MGCTLSQFHASEDMLLELVSEAEAINVRLAVNEAAAPVLNRAPIPTRACSCALASWPA
jgi:hypothetical protein